MNLNVQLLLFLCCLTGTFVFAGVETGFVSWNQMKISYLAEKGNRIGRWGSFLNTNKNRVLSAILIGSNISIVGASLFFNKLITQIDQISFIAKIPSPESWILTPFVVLFCEMLPKSLFRLYSFQLTLRFIPALVIVYYITVPLTSLFELFTNGFRKAVIREEQTFKTKIREEMVLVTMEGSRTGALFDSANILFHNILELKNRHLTEIMRPIERGQNGVYFKATDTLTMIKSCKTHSHEIIIYDVNGNKPIGYVSLIDIAIANFDDKVLKFIRPLLIINENISLLSALKIVFADQRNIFLVSGNDGKINGILKKTDLFSAAFGSRTVDLKPLFV